MQDKNQIKKILADKERGVSLIITFFIMMIILAVVLSISILLYSEVKVIRNIGNSMVSFFAADSGIEKVLYYDYQVVPTTSGGSCSSSADCTLPQTCDPKNGICEFTAARGLCSMYPYDAANNPNGCAKFSDTLSNVTNPSTNIFCEPNLGFLTPLSLSTDHNGCDPTVCDDCQISFHTTLDNGANYYTTAKVYPSDDTITGINNSNFEIESKGSFGSAGRQIKISIKAISAAELIQISGDCVQPKSVGQGETVFISAQVEIGAGFSGTDNIGSVAAVIYNSQGSYYGADGNLSHTCVDDSGCSLAEQCVNTLCAPKLSLTSGTQSSGSWTYTWSTNNVQKYYVDLVVTDTTAPPHVKKVPSIPPCGF